jgi:hypothetical protein
MAQNVVQILDGPRRLEKSDPDPDQNRPDPQHWVLRTTDTCNDKKNQWIINASNNHC